MTRRKAIPALGLILGICAGAFFAAIGLAIVIIQGPAMLERLGLTVMSMIGFYLVAGGSAGLLVGALFPLTTWRWGAVAVGCIAAVPVYAGAGLLLGDLNIILDLLLAAVVGGAVGYSVWEPATA